MCLIICTYCTGKNIYFNFMFICEQQVFNPYIYYINSQFAIFGKHGFILFYFNEDLHFA